jgi:hypothetical protein
VCFVLYLFSPVAFAYFGSLVARLGDIRGGFKYSTLAKAMVEKLQLKEIAGQVLFIHNEVGSYSLVFDIFCKSRLILNLYQITCFIEPISAANVYRLEGEAIALAAGDV